MRFRKRVRICKGVSLNLSGSGISASVGVRGASVTVGKNGIYGNCGIPGTGIYDRKKIASFGNTSSRGRTNSYNNTSSPRKAYFNVSVSLNDKGAPILEVFDQQGTLVTDEKIINKLKRDPQYKEKILQLSQEKKSEIEGQLNSLINIFRLTECPILDPHPFEVKLRALKQQRYTKQNYSVPQPDIADIRSRLESEAKESISSILFWTIKAKREKYVLERIDQQFASALSKWEAAKIDYEESEILKEEVKNKQYAEAYINRRAKLEGFLNGGEEYISQCIESVLSQMVLPVNFSIDFDYKEDEGRLLIDLDLPEVEDMPTTKVNELASGKISIKNKTTKEISNDYATCVCGLALYFAGLLFNVSTKIKEVEVSGYTQRIDPKDGNIKDDYIYAVRFDRCNFAEIEYRNIDPTESIRIFPHVMNLSKAFIFKTIDPNTL